MRAQDIELFRRLVLTRSGLSLSADKDYLIESRLLPLAQRHGFASIEEIAEALRMDPHGHLARDIVEAMQTSESFFFRDIKPFEKFRNFVLPGLLKTRADRRHIRIWSAACAGGQEPYSLAMILADEMVKLAGWRVEIVASDISTEMVERARTGLYSQFEVQRGLPIRNLLQYFVQRGERWELVPAIRRMVRLQQHNLLDDCTPLGRFDVIFCRNVLIYFEQGTKRRVVERLAGLLPADGTLFLGGTEAMLGISEAFETIADHPGLYRPRTAQSGLKAS